MGKQDLFVLASFPLCVNALAVQCSVIDWFLEEPVPSGYPM